MKDKDFNRIVELSWVGGGFIPANERAADLCDQLARGEVVAFLECTGRDLSFHRCYMLLLAEIYGYMPPKFKSAVPKDKFYTFLKHLQGKYRVIFEFKDGTRMVEYESIAFGNMSQQRFREYVKEQLPFIYSDVLGCYFEGEMLDGIIENIETSFEQFLARL